MVVRVGTRTGRTDPRQMSLWDWLNPVPSEPVAGTAPAVTKAAKVRTAKARPREARGQLGYHAGVAAELRVAQDYERRGFPVARQRWRGKGGEIDLIVRDGDGLVFVEVKKSRSFERAAERLSRRQIQRLQVAAEEFLGTQPKGSLTEVRFDLAMLNEHGELRVLENAFGGW